MAQKTKAQIAAEILANLSDSTKGAISSNFLNGILKDIADSLQNNQTGQTKLLAVAPSFQGTTAGLSNGTDTVTTYRYAITTTQAVHDLQLLYGNFSIPSTDVEAGSGNAVTFTAGVEYNSQTLQVTFGGATSGSCPNNGTLMSDVVGISIPAGATYYIRTCVTVTSSQKWCYSYPGTTNDTLVNGSDSSTGTGALGATGNDVGIVGPHAILGYTYPLTPGAVLCVGDSIAAGTGDYISRDSFIVRALLTAGVPFINTATGGTSFQTRDTLANVTSRSKAYNYAQFAIVELGTNDTHIQVVATMQSHALSIWTQLANRGQQVYQTTLTPHATSTDNFVTATNQTPYGLLATAATNASPIAVTTNGNHFLTTGQTVTISGATGNTAANGTWTVTVTGATTLTLNGSTGNGTYGANSATVQCYESIRVFFNTWVRAGAPIDPTAKTAVAVGTAGALVAGQSGHPLTGYFEIANLVEANNSNTLTQNGGVWQVVGTSPVASGTATSGNTLQLFDTTQSWTVNAYAGLNVVITGGTGAGQSAAIASNTSTYLLLLASWPIAPDATSTYVIQNVPTGDGTHPSPNNHIRMAGGITTSLFAPL